MKNREELAALRRRAESGLREVLDFFLTHGMDDAGGFYGVVGRDLVPDPEANRSLVLITRLLWSFAAGYRVLGDERYLAAARRAFAYLERCFIDPEYGGAYWGVRADGTPHETLKQTYGESFVIYGASELYRAAGDPAALALAKNVYGLLEEHVLDRENGGYFECYDRKWNRLDRSFNIPDTRRASKALNTHLHLIESYTNLMRVWDDPALVSRVGELIDIMSHKLLDREICHYKPYMTDDWQNAGQLVSFGHDIEGAWLLTEAAEAYGDAALLAEARPLSVKIADACARGVDPESGGMWSERDAAGDIDRSMVWWVQAEAVVGFFNAWQLTGEARYLALSRGVWDYIDRCIIDREGGVYRDWLSDGAASVREPVNLRTINPWKTPYHNGRMYMEIYERCSALLEE